MSLEEVNTKTLLKNDPQLASINFEKYGHAASEGRIEKTKQALEAKKHKVTVVDTKKDALDVIKNTITKGATVSQAGSVSLMEIGWSEYSSAKDAPFRNLYHEAISENDAQKRGEIRRHGLTADFFLSSVTAVAETGEITVCDLSGTRTGAFTGAAKNLILVVGAQKLVGTLAEALERQEHYCLPMESGRVRIAYKIPASTINNSVVISGSLFPNRVHVILVKEPLGY